MDEFLEDHLRHRIKELEVTGDEAKSEALEALKETTDALAWLCGALRDQATGHPEALAMWNSTETVRRIEQARAVLKKHSEGATYAVAGLAGMAWRDIAKPDEFDPIGQLQKYTVCGWAMFCELEREKVRERQLQWPEIFYQYGVRSFVRFAFAKNTDEAINRARAEMQSVFARQALCAEAIHIFAVFSGVLDNIK